MSEPRSEYPSEEDVDAVLEEFGGDARAATAALLANVATLAADYAAHVAHGFVREQALLTPRSPVWRA